MAKKISEQAEPEQTPPTINPSLRRLRRPQKSAQDFVTSIRRGDVVALSQAITLVESTRAEDHPKARAIVEGCLPYSGQSFRLGITGVPGVGKSTFIEAFGLQTVATGKKVAVLAVDPTSQLTRGSILGDKTRMGQLSTHPQVFIRPSPAGDFLGGVATKTRELILLCEAAGFDFIIVETVGVGQSETAVRDLTDFFLLLLLPGAGDELQGIKRGVVEMADLIAVNKADGDRQTLAKQARAEYQRALHLFPPKDSKWTARALTCSALSGVGIDNISTVIDQYQAHCQQSGFFAANRQQQAGHWFRQSLEAAILQQFYTAEDRKAKVEELLTKVRSGECSPQAAVEALLKGRKV